jgi:ADP-ribose pyrophosphatase YjhB (NUDIX family)
VTVARRAARGILIDEDGQLVLIRRTKPGLPVYWTTPGGGIEDEDAGAEAAMHREIFEELGATATGAFPVFLVSDSSRAGLKIHYFFLARLASLDVSLRNGPEFTASGKGRYDPDRVSLRGDGAALAAIDLRPPELKAFILANREALLADAGVAIPDEAPPSPVPPAGRPGALAAEAALPSRSRPDSRRDRPARLA